MCAQFWTSPETPRISQSTIALRGLRGPSNARPNSNVRIFQTGVHLTASIDTPVMRWTNPQLWTSLETPRTSQSTIMLRVLRGPSIRSLNESPIRTQVFLALRSPDRISIRRSEPEPREPMSPSVRGAQINNTYAFKYRPVTSREGGGAILAGWPIRAPEYVYYILIG